MSERFITSFKEWDAVYGRLLTWFFRAIFAVALFAGKSYLDGHYVNKEHFDKAMTTLAAEKQRYASEQKQDTKEIIGKLDTIIVQQAANTQRLTESERRLSRIEAQSDRGY